MAWEQVGRRRYYYRYHKERGRCVRVYAGTGQAGELAATADQLRRLSRLLAGREMMEEQASRRLAARPLLGLCELAEALARAALVAAGYLRHDRGEWRRRHDRAVTG